MDWTGVTNNPTFTGPKSATLNIFGSLNLTSNMNFSFQGETLFIGDEFDKTINYAGHSGGEAILFNGNGKWVLESAISVDSMFQVRKGELNTNNQDIDCRFFYLNSTGAKNINLTNSKITITGEFLDTYRYDGEDVRSMVIETNDLTLIPGNSIITLTANTPSLWFSGDKNVSLNNVLFTNTSGRAVITNDYFDNALSINELHLFSSAIITGKLTVSSLNLLGGNVYEFESGEVFNFGSINANGNCAKGVVIIATNGGAHATFNVATGIVEIEFLTLRDIHTSGSASFQANSGVDLGNNTGWMFTNSNSVDYYWVGGTGNWSESSHWSLTSGGPAGGCVPSGKDNVFFDANSFSAANQIVSVDKENIYVHDMTWNGVTNNPEYTGDLDFKIRVTGSLELDANMQHTFEGNYFFETNETGKTIRMNGNMFNREITFGGINGEWKFLDDVEVVWNINLLSGHLITNGVDVTLLRLLSETEFDRTLDISNSYLRFRTVMYENPYMSIKFEKYIVKADNSTIEFQDGYAGFNHNGYNNTGYVPEYNVVIISGYSGDIGSYNWALNPGMPSLIVDSLIFNSRGYFYGSNDINYVELRAGYDYSFSSYEVNTTQIINELVASGSCEEGYTKLYTSVPGRKSSISINKDYSFEKLDISDIEIKGSGNFVAQNSIDAGGNTAIIFSDVVVPRQLYWVGDAGAWHDESHWSLSSGGPGGECIPTILDDVFFDANSFSLSNQEVYSEGDRYRYCHDITWTNTIGTPNFMSNYLWVNGSIEYDNSFNNWVWQTTLTSPDKEEVYTNGQRFNLINIRGSGEFTFKDDVEAYELQHFNGFFIFDNINAEFERIHFLFDIQKSADFRNSTILLTGNGEPNYLPFVDESGTISILPGNSTIKFTGNQTGINSISDIELNNVLFENPNGQAYLVSRYYWDPNIMNGLLTANSIVFNGNGQAFGNIETDTLIGAPGKTYILESNRENKVNSYLRMIGNNCTPIELRASNQGTKTKIIMPASGKVIADFVQMQDIIGTGGADFNAGSRSTDIGNSNIGWTFEDAPDFIESGFLGVDRALCTGEDLVLNAYSFSPNEQYTWSDASTDSVLTVSNPGIYFVQVQFQSDCILKDTIEIFTAQDIMAMLPLDPVICENEIFTFDATVPIATAKYLWNDGSTSPTLDADTKGDYSVEIDVDGCISSASATLDVVNNPGLDLGLDLSFCEGSTFNLQSNVMVTTYLWQDGSTSSSFMGNQEGEYWIEIDFNNCFFRDSILVTEVLLPNAEIGNDTLICNNESLILEVENPLGHSILWQDGTTSNENLVTDEGSYVVLVDDNGCINKDSIYVTIQNAPILDLGPDLEGCEGDTFNLSSNIIADSYMWSTGNLTKDIVVSPISTTDYMLTINDNVCEVNASLTIKVNEYPEVDLGSSPLEHCDSEVLILSSGMEGIWQDGTIDDSYTVLSDGTYSVTVTNDGCSSIASIEVDIVESPVIDLGPDITKCEGEEVLISVPDPSINFVWDDGSINGQRKFLVTGKYWLELEQYGCFTRDSININFLNVPKIELGLDTTVCDDDPYLLRPISFSDGNIVWDDGSTENSLLVSSARLVKVSISEDICSSSDSILISFKDCIAFEAFIPNVFSPNEDGINDRFEIFFSEGLIIESFKMEVFDRWGNKVFASNQPEDFWDGRFNTKTLDNGTYLYYIDVAYIDDFGPSAEKIKGDVTIFK